MTDCSSESWKMCSICEMVPIKEDGQIQHGYLGWSSLIVRPAVLGSEQRESNGCVALAGPRHELCSRRGSKANQEVINRGKSL